MLQIPDHTLLKNGRGYNYYAGEYLPEISYNSTKTTNEQRERLAKLDESIIHEQFYFTTDIKSNTISYCNGISRWLGYSDSHFNIHKLKKIIHPTHTFLQAIYATAIFTSLIDRKIEPKNSSTLCVTSIALQHVNGHYLYCKCVTSPFKLVDDGKMTSYLCVFNIVKTFNNEDFSLRLLDVNGKHQITETTMIQNVQSKFKNECFFSFQEYRILKKYAYDSKSTSDLIAKSLQLEKSTIDTYNKRILKKAEEIFSQQFSKAKKVAAYLKMAGLI